MTALDWSYLLIGVFCGLLLGVGLSFFADWHVGHMRRRWSR